MAWRLSRVVSIKGEQQTEWWHGDVLYDVPALAKVAANTAGLTDGDG